MPYPFYRKALKRQQKEKVQPSLDFRDSCLFLPEEKEKKNGKSRERNSYMTFLNCGGSPAVVFACARVQSPTLTSGSLRTTGRQSGWII